MLHPLTVCMYVFFPDQPKDNQAEGHISRTATYLTHLCIYNLF